MIERKITFKGYFLIVVVFLALQLSVFGQTQNVNSIDRYVDQSAGLTADEAVKTALENNDQLLALIKEAEAAEKLVKQSEQRARASVDANGLQQVIGKSHRYTIQGSLPLELGGRRGARVLVASRVAEIKRKAVENAESEIAARIRKKFGEALAKALKLELTEEMLVSLRESYRLVQERVKEGKTAPLEQNIFLVEVNRLRSTREIDESKVQVALLELRNILGMSPELPLKLKGQLENGLAILPGLSELTAQALQRRPDLVLLEAMENLADAKIDSAKTIGTFDANATLGYQRLRISESVQFNYLVFGMKFILPQRNRNRDAIEAAVLTKQATEKRRAFGELTLRQEVAKAYSKYNSAVRAKEIMRVGVVEQAGKNLDVVRQTYEFGENSLLDFLAEQRRYIDLKESLINAALEVYLAKVEIDRAINAPELITR